MELLPNVIFRFSILTYMYIELEIVNLNVNRNCNMNKYMKCALEKSITAKDHIMIGFTILNMFYDSFEDMVKCQFDLEKVEQSMIIRFTLLINMNKSKYMNLTLKSLGGSRSHVM